MNKQKPSFTEVMEFNDTIWDRFRSGFASGDFTKQEALAFLAGHMIIDRSKPTKSGEYVIFKEIVSHLKAIITKEHAYYIHEKKDGKSYMFLDNDHGHWIEDEYLYLCPPGEIKKRSSYR